MVAVFLLIWFWLYAGCLFTNTMSAMQLFEYASAWKKTLFWPYYAVELIIQYFTNKEEDDSRAA